MAKRGRNPRNYLEEVALNEEPVSGDAVKVLALTTEEGAYCLTEFEIPREAFLKHAVQVSRSEPDIFAVVVNNLTKKARELLGI
jgi:hypothetical protein